MSQFGPASLFIKLTEPFIIYISTPMMQSRRGYTFYKMISISRSIPVILHPSEATPTVPYFLSNLDQNIAVLVKVIYFFQANTCPSGGGGDGNGNENISYVLRTSLQKALVHFYPFAGRLSLAGDGKLFVRFNGDGGVPFVEAAADCELEQLGGISFANAEDLLQLIYYPPPAENILEQPLLSLQLTKFKCGGFSIGITFHHSIADGISIQKCLQAWAETARGLPLSLPPFLDRSVLHASQTPDPKFHHPEYVELAPYISVPSNSLPLTRSFVLDSAKLSRLKQLATAPGRDQPSSFASLAGFLWAARTKALNTTSVEPTKLLLPVNVRNLLEPPLPPGYFGNGIIFACCLCPAGLLTNRPLYHAVEMVQDAIQGVTNRFVRSAIDCHELVQARPSSAGTFYLTSWIQLGVELFDFGWGAAAEFELAELMGPEFAVLRPYSKHGKGISITLALLAPAMRAFEEMMDF